MLYRNFGKLGWQVSEISLGTYAIGGNWGKQAESDSLSAISRAIELGVNFIDTADVYGLGKAEVLLGSALKGVRSKVYIATKGGRDFITDPPKITKNFSVEYLSKALDESLKRLGVEHIDLYQLHGPSVDIMKTGEVFNFLVKVKNAGKINGIGISVDSFEEARCAIESGVIDSIQYPYNVLEKKEGKELFQYCLEHNIAVIIREPLAQGLLTDKYKRSNTYPQDDHRSRKWNDSYLEDKVGKLERLRQFKDKNKTLSQVALQFVLAQSGVSTVIPGGRNVNQVNENIYSLSVPAISSSEFEFLSNL